MKTRHLIIDCNNLLCRAHYAVKLTDKKGRSVSGIFGVMRMTENLIKGFKPQNVIVAWDDGKSMERLAIYPEYKAHRELLRSDEEKQALQWQREICQKLFSLLPVRQVMVKNVEADDVIGYLCERLKGKKTIISNDQDFYQLINKDVSLYSANKEMLLNYKNIDDELGFPVKHYILWKSMVGDKCLCGDTKIKLLNGKHIKIKDMTSKEGYWVYSFDRKNKKIVPGKASCSVVTKKVKTLIEVKLDNGEVIRCTDNHPFLLSNGDAYVRADQLSAGDSLMPLYNRVAGREYAYGEYEEIWQKFRVKHKRGKWQATHRMVAENLTVKSKWKRSIHHLDHNSLNNDPENLEWLSDSEHILKHNLENDYENVRKKWKDPSYSEMMREGSRKVGKATGSKNITKYNKSLEKRLVESERQKRLAKQGKHPSQKPENRLKAAIRYREIGKRLAKEKRSAFFMKVFHKKLNSDPDVKEKQLKGKVYKIYKKMLEYGLDYKNWEESLDYLKLNKKTPVNSIKNPLKYFDSFDDIKYFNHKVLSVRVIKLKKSKSVYDIHVQKYYNFALSSGVFVHNSDNIKGIKGIGVVKATKLIKGVIATGKKLPITSDEMEILQINKDIIAIGALLTSKQIKKIIEVYNSETNKSLKPKKVHGIFSGLGFHSLIKYFPMWYSTFKGVKDDGKKEKSRKEKKRKNKKEKGNKKSSKKSKLR